MAVMATSFKRTYASTLQLPGLLQSVPLTPWQATVAHTFAGDSQTLTGKSGSVSCGVTAPFFWVLVHTSFCLCPPRVCFPSPVEVLISLQSQTVGSYRILCLTSWGTTSHFPCQFHHFTYPPAMLDGSNIHILANTCYHFFFKNKFLYSFKSSIVGSFAFP